MTNFILVLHLCNFGIPKHNIAPICSDPSLTEYSSAEECEKKAKYWNEEQKGWKHGWEDKLTNGVLYMKEKAKCVKE